MIDIHTHILPGVDDGAADPAEACRMLAMQRETGVDRLFLTPHYYPLRTEEAQFLEKRACAWAQLQTVAVDFADLQLRLGAEVHFSPQLPELDLRPLTLGDSDYLLLELSGRYYPPFAENVVEGILEQGIVPILAHVERFPYFRKEPKLLKRLIDLGALGQVSAAALWDRQDQGFARACLEHDLAQFAASDAHNSSKRRPDMEPVRKLPQQVQDRLDASARAVWENDQSLTAWPSELKKTFWGYR